MMQKIVPLLAMVVVATCLFGQVNPTGNIPGENKFRALNDSLPQVIYKKTPGTLHPVAWFVNEQLVDEFTTKTVNPEQIASLNVLKQAIKIDQNTYDGQVWMTMKPDYHPKLITLHELKSRYTNIGESSVIYLLDNEYIRGDENKNLVDERYILQILVEKVENNANMVDFYLVRLLTRNPENVKKSKEIRIR